jgi:hypothetical protein
LKQHCGWIEEEGDGDWAGAFRVLLLAQRKHPLLMRHPIRKFPFQEESIDRRCRDRQDLWMQIGPRSFFEEEFSEIIITTQATAPNLIWRHAAHYTAA